MTVSTGAYMKTLYQSVAAMGEKSINSDMAFEIDGHENMWLLCKQAPWPELSSAGEIEIPTPTGGSAFQPQQLKVALQGQVTFLETVAGDVDRMLDAITAQGGKFNAKIYEGTPQKWTSRKHLKDCFFVLDATDRDWENRAQVMTISGTLFYHYFGQTDRI